MRRSRIAWEGPSVTSRRDFLIALSGMAVAGLGDACRSHAAAREVKWSAGTEPPTLKAPPDAADCHHHIYDARFPVDPRATLRPPDALVEDYRGLQKRLGLTRHVIVQPSTYGVDNRCTLDALAAFGPTARAVVVVNEAVTDDELKRLDRLGARGIRFNLTPAGPTTSEMIEPLAKRVAPLGWHVQINAPPGVLGDLMPLVGRLPAPVVFDHLAHIPEPEGVNHPLFASIRGLLARGRAWVKLSGAYLDSRVGPPTYADTSAVARAYVEAAPDRLVWGSDWPHPTERVKPDDALLFDLLLDWVPSERLRQRILVENPAQLYGF
jgi:predicted TIM-barrel fold metal-dependent hydrolase